jgi:hypothetical protein
MCLFFVLLFLFGCFVFVSFCLLLHSTHENEHLFRTRVFAPFHHLHIRHVLNTLASVQTFFDRNVELQEQRMHIGKEVVRQETKVKRLLHTLASLFNSKKELDSHYVNLARKFHDRRFMFKLDTSLPNGGGGTSTMAQTHASSRVVDRLYPHYDDGRRPELAPYDATEYDDVDDDGDDGGGGNAIEYNGEALSRESSFDSEEGDFDDGSDGGGGGGMAEASPRSAERARLAAVGRAARERASLASSGAGGKKGNHALPRLHGRRGESASSRGRVSRGSSQRSSRASSHASQGPHETSWRRNVEDDLARSYTPTERRSAYAQRPEQLKGDGLGYNVL